MEIPKRSRRILILSNYLRRALQQGLPIFALFSILFVVISSLYNVHVLAGLLSLSGSDSVIDNSKFPKEPLSLSEIYRCYFHNISTEKAGEVLAVRLKKATSVHLPASFPNKVVKIKARFSSEKRIIKRGYKFIRYVNPMCLSSRDSSHQICFNTFSNSFFTGSGVAIDIATSSLYEISGGCCMQDWNYFSRKKMRWSSRKSRVSFRENRKRAIFVLCQHHGTTYHHIMYEVIPRYLISLPFIDADPTVRVAIDDSNLLTSILVALGLDERRIIRVNPRKVSMWHGAALLIYPLPVIGHENIYPMFLQMHAVADLLRYKMRFKSREDEGTRQPTLLLMERARKRSLFTHECGEERCLKNFADLKAALALRFPSINVVAFPAVATLSQTISAFASADIVVGVHGAGFQNLMFCRPGTTVVHIGYDVEYHWVANTFRLYFHPVVISGLQHGSRNFQINVTEIVNHVSQAMQQDGRI